MWFVCLVAWIEVILLSRGFDFFFFLNSPLNTRSLSDGWMYMCMCVCVYTRAHVYRVRKKKRRKWQPFLLHTLCECSAARLISEYLWVIVGGKRRRRKEKKSRKRGRQGKCSGFFMYIYIYSLFFSVVVPFLPPLCQYKTTLSRSSHSCRTLLICYANYA